MKLLKTITIAAMLLLPLQARAQSRNAGFDDYNAACTAALAGKTAEAFQLLEKSIKEGFDQYDHLLNRDPDLVSLRKDPKWNDIVKLVEDKQTTLEKIMASLPKPMEAFSNLGKTGYVKTIIALEKMLAEHPDAPAGWKDLLNEVLGWTRAIVGDVHGALAAFDARRSAPRSPMPSDFATYTPVSATEAIAKEAEKTRIVVINEGHHIPMHRVLTRELLKTLYDQGYRYFAVEALWKNEDTKAADFPKMKSSYTADPVFADLLRSAVTQGYTLIPYDTFSNNCQATADDPNACFNARDSLAANNIMKRVFEKDPNAKILTHVGYSHALDNRSAARAKALAWQLSQRTDVDPVTVDQTQMMERTDTTLEEVEYRDVMRRGVTQPVVLRKIDGSFYRSSSDGFGGVDMQVFTPRTKYVDGRPQWLTRLGRNFVTTNVTIPQDGKTYLVQAFVEGQPETAVPVDQTVTVGRSPTLALPKGRFTIVVSGEDGVISRTAVRN